MPLQPVGAGSARGRCHLDETDADLSKKLCARSVTQRSVGSKFSLFLVFIFSILCVGHDARAEQAQPTTTSHAFVGIRVLKIPGAGQVSWVARPSPNCTGCRLVTNDYVSGQNSRELFFHIWIPRTATRGATLSLKIDPRVVRGVLVSYTDVDLPKRGFARPESRANGMARVAFRRITDGITFDVPARPRGVDLPPDDLADVTQDYTYLETPGIYIRVSHADEQRRRGAYATGPWPAVEAKAALNLEFAAREAIDALGIVPKLKSYGVSTIMLMNFDTNYPTLGPDEAHEDWPPHWHMHLLWDDGPKVRKVGHFYISPDGLLTQNQSGDLVSLASKTRRMLWYKRGEADETKTPDGRLIYAHTITPEGYFKLSAPSGSCDFIPIARGFDSGVKLICTNGRRVQVRAEDDVLAGRLRLFLDGKLVSDDAYDADTGALLPQSRPANVATN